jgi:hypothetical protein
MARTIYVNCSFCEGLMEIDTETGEVVQKWSPQEKAAGGDKMEAALKKLNDAKKQRVSLFEKKKDELESQKKKIEDAFKKEVDRIKKEGVKDAPPRPFDLD